MSNAERNRSQAIRMLMDVWQDGKFDQLPSLCTHDVVRHHPRMSANGLDQYRGVVEFYRVAFHELNYQVISAVADDSSAAVVYSISGVHAGPLGPLPPTGVRETVISIDFFQFRNGLISEIHTAFDELGLMLKLGAVQFSSVSQTPKAQDAESTHTHKLSHSDTAKALLTDVWQNGQFDQLPSLVHENVQRHHPRFPATSLSELTGMIQAYRVAFPDMRYRFLHLAESTDNVALIYEVQATHLGLFGQIPPTGITDVMTCLDFFRFRDGKISEIWTMFDELGLLIKMGVIPPLNG